MFVEVVHLKKFIDCKFKLKIDDGLTLPGHLLDSCCDHPGGRGGGFLDDISSGRNSAYKHT